MERTLLNIKPGAVKRNLSGEIIRRIQAAGYRIVAMEQTRLSAREAEAFYAVHKGKSFYDNLIAFMISGPCVPMVVEGEGAINGIRELIGDTDPEKAAEGTIRHEFAETITKNCVHASDSPEAAVEEIGFFFSRRLLLD